MVFFFFHGTIVYYKGVAQEAHTSIIFALALVRAVLLDEYVRRLPPPLHQHDAGDTPVRTVYNAAADSPRSHRLTTPRPVHSSAPAADSPVVIINSAVDNFWPNISR